MSTKLLVPIPSAYVAFYIHLCVDCGRQRGCEISPLGFKASFISKSVVVIIQNTSLLKSLPFFSISSVALFKCIYPFLTFIKGVIFEKYLIRFVALAQMSCKYVSARINGTKVQPHRVRFRCRLIRCE